MGQSQSTRSRTSSISERRSSTGTRPKSGAHIPTVSQNVALGQFKSIPVQDGIASSASPKCDELPIINIQDLSRGRHYCDVAKEASETFGLGEKPVTLNYKSSHSQLVETTLLHPPPPRKTRASSLTSEDETVHKDNGKLVPCVFKWTPKSSAAAARQYSHLNLPLPQMGSQQVKEYDRTVSCPSSKKNNTYIKKQIGTSSNFLPYL